MTITQPPLDQPLYGATLPQAVSRFFRKYATFTGRASRSEYWWTYLVLSLAFGVLGILVGIFGTLTRSPGDDARQPGFGAVPFAIVAILAFLAVIVPIIALHVRRLHDANFSGLIYLLTLIPYLGAFILFIFALLPSNPLGARFDAGAAPVGYPPAPGYTTAPPVQAGPPPQAAPPPVAPPADPPTT